MKSLLFTLLFFLISYSATAGIITVDNRDTTTAQYQDLQTAIDSAQVGDTLLIHRSNTSYGNITLNKRLTLIGEGILPEKQPENSFTTIGNATLSYDPITLTSASKSNFIGLSFTNLTINEKSSDINYACDSILINYCKITTLALKNKEVGLNVNNSIISNINGSLFYCTFKNNFFYTVSCSISQGANNVFTNNFFFLRLNFNGGVVANNILYTNFGGTFSMNAKNVMFSNNIMYSTSTTFDTTAFSSNGNTSTNNLFNVDPMFVNPVIFNALFSYSQTSPASGPFADFHLQAGSPAIGAGTDGTDLGIYGGPTPWRDGGTGDSRYRYFPLPDAVPVITGVTVQNMVVNEGGNIQVQINAVK